MSWYDPNSWFQTGDYDPTNADRDQLRGAAQTLTGAGDQSGTFGNQAANNYGTYNAGLQNTLAGMGQTQDYYRQQMQGQNSVSALQLQQAAQQNMAQQRSMAASASPNNSAAAQRNAMLNSSRVNTGLAGQQALAGLQERNQAAQLLGSSQQAQGQLYGQGAQTAGGLANQAYGNQINAYGGAANAYGTAIQNGEKTTGQMVQGLVGGAAAGLATHYSDRNLKTNVEDADGASKKTLGRLNAYSFDYKDAKHGKGRQLGVMAQDLKRAGLGHAVVRARDGLAVDTGRLSLANTAMLSSLHKRLAKIEDES